MQPDLSCLPPPTEVPMFPPLRPALSRRYRWRRALRPCRRTAAAGLAVAAAALAVSGHAAQPPPVSGAASGTATGTASGTASGAAPPGTAHVSSAADPPPGVSRPPGGGSGDGGSDDGTGAGGGADVGPAPVPRVSAPVRIGDAAAVRLLAAGDRVDVLSTAAPTAGVGSVADSVAASGSAPAAARSLARCARVVQVPAEEENTWSGAEGALVVLDVPRRTASRIAGAAAAGPLAVALC